MSHLLALVLCVTGFAALAFATRRQQRDILHRSLPRAMTNALRIVGACALLLALGVLVAHSGWGLGLVMFSGHTSIAAGIVISMLIAHARTSAKPRHR
jgi:uncharacterized protein involved in propanediol utilization